MQSLFALIALCAAGQGPQFLEDRFEMPAGFRIYRAAGPELTGGSYDITFDGEGRLLVGDGQAVRRLSDDDGDGIYDRFQVMATGLGGRGPQGLLVYGDRLFAVGGDGIQLFEGYRSGGPLEHRGRIGEPFHTGGDHDAHTILRGLDNWLYFITGNNGGTRDRRHITEESSPALFERACSVFRISPDGRRWECIGSGGRNAPNLGVNYLGELFSLDSDMEWHVGMPWWRPVRLHHWIAGGDQGWQDVGAYPPYYLDNLPGIHDIGRGSPDWGLFYEHEQFPEKYRDAFFVCDYLSKSATTGGYATNGRLFAFHLERDGAGWKAAAEVFARPRPGARDPSGRAINFALVDIEVAPDGSLFLSDHNQGVWRIFHDPGGRRSARGAPAVVPEAPEAPAGPAAILDALLSLPQPGSEWSRLREESLRAALGEECERRLEAAALDAGAPSGRRLRAVRLLAPGFESLPEGLLERLASDSAAEIRGQAAWLLGIRGRDEGLPLLRKLFGDGDPFVRRRAAEALGRIPREAATADLIEHLADPSRLVRYAAMTALAHRPTAAWFEDAMARPRAQIRMRALAAAVHRREPPPPDAVRRAVGALLEGASPADSGEDRLDLLRILGLFEETLRDSEDLRDRIRRHLLAGFPDADPGARFEEIRLLGEYRFPEGFAPLLRELEAEGEPVAQFHLAQAIARIPSGWTREEEDRLARWFLGTQSGWFAETSGKGLQFPHFWATVLSEFAERHGEALLRSLPEIDLSSQLGGAAIDSLARGPEAGATLLALYRANERADARTRILGALREVPDPRAAAFLREEYLRLAEPRLRGAALKALAAQPRHPASLPLLQEGLQHPDPDVAGACARALGEQRAELTEALANLLLSRLGDRREVFGAVDGALRALSGAAPPAPADEPRNDGERERRGRAGRERTITFWRRWYEERYGKAFKPAGRREIEKGDEELRDFLAGEESRGGDARGGRRVYEGARCAACHGGIGEAGKDGPIFGPELAGATSRLTRAEVADSIVYPSKQVADRYKAFVVAARGASPLTGFITERSEEVVVLVDQERVHRIPARRVQFIAPQSASLMPERLLNRLSWEEIRDLMAFLEQIGSQAPPPAAPPAGKER